VAFMIVVMAFVVVAIVCRLIAWRCLGRLRRGLFFEGIGGAQRFAFRAQSPRQQS
jgi:hypothetical protein